MGKMWRNPFEGVATTCSNIYKGYVYKICLVCWGVFFGTFSGEQICGSAFLSVDFPSLPAVLDSGDEAWNQPTIGCKGARKTPFLL